MIHRPLHFLLAASLALSAGCHSRPPGTLSVATSPEATGALTLTFVLPREGDRQLAYVPVATTRSVRVTVSGPKLRDDTKAGTPKPFMRTIAGFGIAAGSASATVTVANVRPGNNLTVKVEVFDGPLVGASPAGTPSGKLLETLYGLVNIADNATAAASVNWATTPAGRAMELLREQGDPARVVATDGAALQSLVQTLIDTPTAGANHPVLISGEELGHALNRYTRARPNWPIHQGYAIPAANAPELAGVVAQAAQAPSTRVYDLHATELSASVQLTVGDPISAVDPASPFSFPRIAPGDWWVFTESTADARKGAFYKRFAEGDADALRAAYLPGMATTFAGTGAGGLGTAIAPQFRDPHQVIVDGAGNLIVADTGNHRVVRLNAVGQMTVLAGTGTAGSSGDNGAATAATLRSPEGVALDAAGNLFIADTGNHKLRMIDVATGKIATVAGTGTAGYNDDGTASTRVLSGPTNLAVGGASPPALFFHDSGNKLIRKIPLGGSISTTSVTSLAIPDLTSEHTGMAYKTVGGTEYLYYCQLSPARVVRQTMTGAGAGQRLILAGGGQAVPPLDEGVPGAQVLLGQIRALAVDGDGTVYMGDRWGTSLNHGRVRFVCPDRFAELFTVLGLSGQGAFGVGGLGPDMGAGAPFGLAVPPIPNAPLYVATGGVDHRVVRVAP